MTPVRLLASVRPVYGTAVGLLLSVSSVSAVTAQQSQHGRIIGRVVDEAQGAPIAGAQLEVGDSAAPVRVVSALDGRFVLAPVRAGAASVRVRMIGYQPKTVTQIVVPDGGTAAQDIALSSQAVQLAEIEVTAESERGTVNRALDEQRNSNNIINSITADQISKSPDADAAQAVQRVSGVTVQDGKYIFVRGLGERYTQTSLNGARLPSAEPERKVVPLDLFPSGLLEGITTAKTFTPDLWGDFSGAQVNLKTREFPARRVITFTTSGGFNDRASFKSVVKAPTTGSEWLGFGGSARQLPDAVRSAGDLRGLSQTGVNQLVGSFRNVWSAPSVNGSPNAGLGMSIGGSDRLFGGPLGYLLSFNYKYNQEIRADETRGLAAGNEPHTQPFNTYQGETGRRSVLWGGIANVTSRIGSSTKFSFNNALTRGADNEAEVLVGNNEEFSQFNPLYTTRLLFVERAVRSNQLLGEHRLGLRHSLDWSVTNAHVRRNEPDRSDLTYTGAAGSGIGEMQPVMWPGAPRFATRTFTDLSETSWDFGVNYRLALGSTNNPVSLKLGGAFRTSSRDADTRAYDIINNTLTDAQRTAAPEVVFGSQDVDASAFLLSPNVNGGRYTADEKIGAGYLMLDVPLTRRLQIVGGARLEGWRVDVLTVDPLGTQTQARPRANDILPSLALKYALTRSQNLRLSASQTLSRPEYRELSPSAYFEQVGLLITRGNPNLARALIQNYDVRWEWFTGPGEVISIGAFYKRFNNPIEKIIQLQAGSLALGFVNADQAKNYGLELELRKSLGVLADALRPFTLFANSTLMKSDITPGQQGGSALTRSNRPMVGQSEYVVNTGLTFATTGGFSATALFNVAGRRILEAGAGGLPDSYEEPRNLLDVALEVPLSQAISLKLDGKNLLDSPYRLTQGGVIRQRWNLGRDFGFSVTWRQ